MQYSRRFVKLSAVERPELSLRKLARLSDEGLEMADAVQPDAKDPDILTGALEERPLCDRAYETLEDPPLRDIVDRLCAAPVGMAAALLPVHPAEPRAHPRRRARRRLSGVKPGRCTQSPPGMKGFTSGTGQTPAPDESSRSF